MEDPFTTLGIEPTFDLDLVQVEKRFRDLSRVLHPDRHVASVPAERRMALGRAVEVNAAFRLVRDPIQRAEALLRLRGVTVGETGEPPAEPAFLMEMMELREALGEAKASGDGARLAQLAAAVRDRQDAALVRMSAGLAGGQAQELVPVLGELRYYRRFLDEVSAVEEAQSEATP